jgi:large subunit ribosomal protein L25
MPRTELGKGPARRERRAGRVPAVLYGHGTEPRHLSLPGHEVLMALRTPNVLIRLDGIPGGSQMALPRSIQRDPIKGWVEHVDLLLVRRGEKVTVDVPVVVVGEVVADGLLDQPMVQVSVQAEATHIPPSIEVNVADMAIGTVVTAGDLDLPSGVTLEEEPEAMVLHVIPAPTAAQIEAELGVVPEAPEEAAEAAPAEAKADAEAGAGAAGEPDQAG